MKAARVDVSRECYGVTRADVDAEAAALADRLVYFHSNARLRLGHVSYFVTPTLLPLPPSSCLPGKLDV